MFLTDFLVARFSISKWIHLNGGDEGLRTFFRRVHEVLKPGGTFILEPQEWDTYGKAKRMDPVRDVVSLDGYRPLISVLSGSKRMRNTYCCDQMTSGVCCRRLALDRQCTWGRQGKGVR